VVNPVGLAKYEQGQQIQIDWHSAGLNLFDPVLLLNAGGGLTLDALAGWGRDEYRTGGYTNSTTNAIDRTGAVNPAPEAVYKSVAYTDGTLGSAISWALPVMTAYTLRLHRGVLHGPNTRISRDGGGEEENNSTSTPRPAG
jgi:hypothetical protein